MSIYKSLKELFKYGTLISIVKNKKKSILKNFQNENEPVSNKDLYEKTYKKLFTEHKYEYIFKNEFLCTHLKDLIEGNTKLLYEVKLYENNILANILDMLYITKNSAYAIEIKSDFDTPIRLEKQLNTYTKLFKYVSIFVSENKKEEYIQYLDEMDLNNIGLIILKNDKIETIKPPLLNELDKTMLINNIYQNFFKIINPETDIEIIYNTWITLLNQQEFDFKFTLKMPRSLAFFAYSHSNIKKLRKARLIKFFENTQMEN